MTSNLLKQAVRSMAVLLLLPLLAPSAMASESYDSCTAFIGMHELPATITSPGIYCLRGDLEADQASDNVIAIAADDVTIDCNGYTLSGLAAGAGTTAQGIASNGTASRATVRNCRVQGFYRGINLSGGSAHLVEHNQVERNTFMGIRSYAANSTVRNNRVFDNGSASLTYAYGVYAMGDVSDNTVSGVVAKSPFGIVVYGDGGEVRGNTVQNLVPGVGGSASGIYAGHGKVALTGNRVTAPAATTGLGINGYGADTFCKQNVVSQYSTAYYGCEFDLRNLAD